MKLIYLTTILPQALAWLLHSDRVTTSWYKQKYKRKVRISHKWCTRLHGGCQNLSQDSGTQPALHFGGGIFNFIRWRHRANSTVVQLFRKRSQDIDNENFLVLIKTERSGQSKNW